ncbi:MAG: hypothetical protein ICV60_09125 [Pyrinomonadaceae bacterium]|nr:hypothetical protein [Pyrinomonadaceae bacterium]
MHAFSRLLLILFALLCFSLCAQAEPTQKSGTGVITGRIMVADKPAPGVVVIAAPAEPGPNRKEAGRATTDYEGNYRLIALPAGRYNIMPLAPTLVSLSEGMYGGVGRFVLLGEGETVEKIDFSLARAGVITGRITDADGKPVIEERVQLNAADNSSSPPYGRYSNPFMYQTDDRGVYRLYGIPPGRYTLSVGISQDEGMVRVGAVRRGYYQRTFYPGETDVKKAAIIEVTEGSEVKDVDIKLGRPAQSFSVAGRVVDAETGQPVPNQIIGYGTYDAQRRQMNGFGYGDTRSDARGEFRLEGVVPGRFAAFVWSENNVYTDPVLFEVTEGDVTGLELKLKRGASISGTVQLEGPADKNVLARLTRLTLFTVVQTKNLSPPENRQTSINADGSFRLTGLPPGRVFIHLAGSQTTKDFRLLRVERDGAPQPSGIDVAPGAEITNVRLVFEYGSGTIRGQVRFENGALPEGSRIFVTAERPGAGDGGAQPVTVQARPLAYSQADARGRFILEGLSAGDYQVVVRAQFPLSNGGGKLVTGKQSVTISNGMETEITVTLDLADKGPGVQE